MADTLTELLASLNQLEAVEPARGLMPQSQAELLTSTPEMGAMRGLANLALAIGNIRRARSGKMEAQSLASARETAEKALLGLPLSQPPQTNARQAGTFERPTSAPPAQGPLKKIGQAIKTGAGKVFTPKPSTGQRAAEGFERTVRGLTPEQLQDPDVRNYIARTAGIPIETPPREDPLQRRLMEARVAQAESDIGGKEFVPLSVDAAKAIQKLVPGLDADALLAVGATPQGAEILSNIIPRLTSGQMAGQNISQRGAVSENLAKVNQAFAMERARLLEAGKNERAAGAGEKGLRLSAFDALVNNHMGRLTEEDLKRYAEIAKTIAANQRTTPSAPASPLDVFLSQAK